MSSIVSQRGRCDDLTHRPLTTPKGAKFHVSWMGKDGFHVLDLWESREDFERFVQERLTPAVQRIGIKGEPKVEFQEAIAVFAPNV